LVDGPKEYRQQRDLFLRLDELLSVAGLEREFLKLSMAHWQIDLGKCSAADDRSSANLVRLNSARNILCKDATNRVLNKSLFGLDDFYSSP